MRRNNSQCFKPTDFKKKMDTAREKANSLSKRVSSEKEVKMPDVQNEIEGTDFRA